MLIIGVVAPPAGGKSTVAAMLESLGATWINADSIAHQILQRPDLRARVVAAFGPEIVNDDGAINRKSLGKFVFGDDSEKVAARRTLEEIVHPAVRAEISRQLIQAARSLAPGVVLDIPLLFEGGWANQCDEVWFIDTAAKIQSDEATRRGWTMENLNRRQSSQLSLVEKRRLSTRVIPNHETLASLRSRIEKIWTDCVSPTAIAGVQFGPPNHCHPEPPGDS